ncbi:MAG: hypothetical protein AAF518_22480 [Spirochaetota bacterium]
MFRFILIFLLSIPTLIQAETIIFTSGKYIECEVLGQTLETVTYKYKGKETKIAKRKVHRIVFDSNPSSAKKTIRKEVALLKRKRKRRRLESKIKDMQEIVDGLEKRVQFLEIQSEVHLKKLGEELQKELAQVKEQIAKLNKVNTELKKDAKDVDDKKTTDPTPSNATSLADSKRLKDRVGRLEEYLELEPEVSEYYSQKRKIWSPLWRSAAIPGWGHIYTNHTFLGSFYNVMFVTLGLAGAGMQNNANDIKNSGNRKFQRAALQNLFFQSFLSSTIATATAEGTSAGITNEQVSLYQNFTTFRDYSKYTDSLKDATVAKRRGNSMLNLAVGIYVIQLVHSYFITKEWVTRPPGKFSDFSSSHTSQNKGWRVTWNPTGTLANQKVLSAKSLNQGQTTLSYHFLF